MGDQREGQAADGEGEKRKMGAKRAERVVGCVIKRRMESVRRGARGKRYLYLRTDREVEGKSGVVGAFPERVRANPQRAGGYSRHTATGRAKLRRAERAAVRAHLPLHTLR